MSARAGDVQLEDIAIRTDLHARDIARIVQLHGPLYQQEFSYGMAFESYVSAGLYEFLRHYDPHRNRFWLCEHAGSLIGCLGLLDRGNSAQLRFFLIHPRYRRLGLARQLLDKFFAFIQACGYTSAYLWTTHELTAAARLYTAYGFLIAEEKTSNAFGKVLVEHKYIKVMNEASNNR